MTARTSRKHTTALALALSMVLSSFAGAAMLALPAQADSPEVSHTPQHVWVDPTVTNVDGNYEWSVTLRMPEITEPAVISASAPQFTTGSVNCQAPDAVDRGVLSCVGQGDAIPGTYYIDVELRVVAGTLYTWQIPLTVCPLTGCSDLYSLTISPDPMVIWASPTITEQTYGQYDFNTDWNAQEVKLDELRDAQGNIAPGIYDPISEPPKNGAKFGYRGELTRPGYYFGTVTMIDEFGGEHEAPYTVRVCTPELCRELLELPDTGVELVAMAAAGGFAAVAIVAGAVVLVMRRRKA